MDYNRAYPMCEKYVFKVTSFLRTLLKQSLKSSVRPYLPRDSHAASTRRANPTRLAWI